MRNVFRVLSTIATKEVIFTRTNLTRQNFHQYHQILFLNNVRHLSVAEPRNLAKPMIKMTQVATPSDYQQPTINPNNGTDNTTTTNTKDSKIYIHTGNIANWTNVKSRRSNEMPTNELYQSLCRTITKHGSQQLGGWNEEEIRINCTNTEKIDSVERGLLKVTAKIFLQKLDTKSMVNSVNSTLKQLGLHSIDSLYLALPPFAENQPFAETILPLWEEMERFRDAGLATQISTCDLDHEKLKTLVEMVKIRPEVNQVNLTSCCHMPEDLVQYAKEIGIVLHTHGDQAVMLPDENVEALINVLKPDDDRTFSTDWIVRYAVVVKCRGVIKSKGYIAAIDALTNTE